MQLKKPIEIDLILDYEAICEKIVAKFAKKQDLDFDGWIGDDIGGIASFSCEFTFSIDDVVLDLKTKQRKGFIIKWLREGVDFYFETGRDSHINYKSYINGLRYKDLKTKFMNEEKTKLRKPKKYRAFNGLVLIGTTFAIDSARLLAENYGDRVVFKRNGEIVEEFIKP